MVYALHLPKVVILCVPRVVSKSDAFMSICLDLHLTLLLEVLEQRLAGLAECDSQ